MYRFIIATLATVFIVAIGFVGHPSHVKGQVPITGGGASVAGFAASCTVSANFLARTSGMSTAQKTNYDTMLCGMETDGVGCTASIDALWVLSAPTSTIAGLNLCGSSGTLTTHGGMTFSANQYYVGNGSTGYIDTGLDLSVVHSGGGHVAAASAFIASYITTSRTAGQNYIEAGVLVSGSNATQILPNFDGSDDFSLVTGTSLTNTSSTLFQVQGNRIYNKPSSATLAVYIDGAKVTGLTFSGADQLQTGNVYISARNNAGTPDSFSADQLAVIAFGGGFASDALACKFDRRINNFQIAIGNSVYANAC